MDNLLAAEYLKQGEVLLENEKYEYSIDYLKKAEQENPFNSDIYFGLGIAHTNLNQYEEAESAYLKAIKVNREEGKVYFHLGNVYFLKNDKVKGIQNYNEAIAKGYDDPQLYYNLGIMHEEENDDILALRNYSKAIMKAPFRGEIRLRKAQLYIKQKKYHEASQTLDEMTVACPDYFEGYHMKIRLLTDMGEHENALAALEKAKIVFPEDSGFILDEVNIYINLNRLEEALELLETEENRAENRLDTREAAIERARIYALKGNMQETINNLLKAKESSQKKNPPESDPMTEYFLMNCYINTNEYEQAFGYAKALKDLDEMSYYKLASYYYEPYCLSKMKKEEEAKQLYKLAIETLRNYTLNDPHNLDAYIFRILCLKDLQMYEKALELLDYVLKIKNDSSEFYALRGVVLSLMGREDEASKDREKSKSLGGITAKLLNETIEK